LLISFDNSVSLRGPEGRGNLLYKVVVASEEWQSHKNKMNIILIKEIASSLCSSHDTICDEISLYFHTSLTHLIEKSIILRLKL
jgi:proline dehydrogenase